MASKRLLQDYSRGRFVRANEADGWTEPDVKLGALLRLTEAAERIANILEDRVPHGRGVDVTEIHRRLRALEAVNQETR